VLRTLRGLTQEKLGKALGLTFQQVQKYERGTNRISASRLHQLGGILDVPVSYFFDEMDEADAGPRRAPAGNDIEPDPATKRETLELIRAYYAIDNPSHRKQLYELVKAIAASGRG